MCITFFLANSTGSGPYKLVVFFNRDEFLERPTEPAAWKPIKSGGDQVQVLAGRDLTTGREGGTWLAVDQRGRVGMLTNIFTGTAPDKTAAGRGFLVMDYLAGDMSAPKYLEALSQSRKAYSPFNLVLMEPVLGPDGSVVTYRQGLDKPRFA